ncbi:MAG: 50S ribosomal protein L25/general stress protein Ctc [Pseudomonadota bacterium]
MAKQYALAATKRDGTGKGVARALRREEKIPAVIYGDNKSPVTIAMSANEANVEYNKGHMFTTLCELDLEGSKELVLARDVQLHPVKDNVMHIDFLRVSDKTTITVAVPVTYANQESAKYNDEKGVLNVVRFEVDVVCKAKNIPDEIVVDLSDFEIGDSVKISNADMPEGAKPAIDDRDFTLATVTAPRMIVEEEETEEGAEGEEGAEASAEGGEGDAPAEGAEEKKED